MDIEAIVKKHFDRWVTDTEFGNVEVHLRAALTELAAELDSKQALLLEAHCERVSSLQERIRQLDARLGGYLTVGGGHIVHGTSEALARVQAYILLDSKHQIEARDTNRYFAKELQAAEQQIKQLEAALAKSRERAERMLDAIDKLQPLASRTLWMAFVWNDHNFTHPLDYAREEAKKAGLNCLEDAQEFLADVAVLAAAPKK